MNRSLFSGTGLLVALVIFVAINIISNTTLTSWRLDLTENRLYTLSDGTLNILESLQEPITLRYYYSAKAFAGIPPLLNYGLRVREMLEEYETRSDGMIDLRIIDPEPFSEAEDEAVGYGVQQIPVSSAGDLGYLGLFGTNTTDDEMLIPVFQPNEEQSLEYELTKMIYKLANPKQRVIGVLSTLPVFGARANPMLGTQASEAWTIVTMLREAYELRDLGRSVTVIDSAIDTLMVIHPKNLTPETRYAIDQFVIKGGKAIIFVDPFAEEDQTQPNMEMGMMVPERGSELSDLLAAWGLKMREQKVAGDIDAAIRVSFSSGRGPQEVEYLPWLQLGHENFNSQDFVTNQLESVNLGSAGILEVQTDSGTDITSLLQTGPNATEIERDAVFFVRDPAGLLEGYTPEGKPLILAVRVRGDVKTAFPDGKPKAEEDEEASEDPDFLAQSSSPINVVIVADTDILADRFWVQIQNFLGIRMPTPIADNANFVINAIDNLGGNDDLISLRSRGQSIRPFDRVTDIRRQAEEQFRDKERQLQAKLEETENKISQLQQERDAAGDLLLSPAQREAIETFRDEQIKIRKELRTVQHDLQKNIQRLGTQLKFINIGSIPLLIGLFAVGLSVAQFTRRSRMRQRPQN